jgi:putative FmdB family regulatory protein
VPTYEYRCPDGHVFEIFKSITAPAPEACPMCGKSPVTVVLHPVAVHFKGSGFYSTDYGKGSKRKDAASKDGASAGDSGSSGDSGSGEKADTKKAAEA